jgi:hypothetical protein
LIRRALQAQEALSKKFQVFPSSGSTRSYSSIIIIIIIIVVEDFLKYRKGLVELQFIDSTFLTSGAFDLETVILIIEFHAAALARSRS